MKRFERPSFLQTIRWRVRLGWAALAAMLVYMVVVAELGGGDSRTMSDLASSMSRILFFGGMIAVGVRIHHNRKLLRDAALRKEQFVRERDERNRFLHDKSGGAVLDVLLLCIWFVTVTCALFDNAAFLVSFAILVTALALKGAAYFAYSRLG